MQLPWAMSLISNLAIRAYYRVTVAGARVPADGPVLLVANHNNSLVDPALVVCAADRTVRFLAKYPLFVDPLIGWLVKAVGSVPVYRQQDDPTKLSQNLDSFRDVHAVLAAGDAIGIFPEGISHSSAQLAPLKTGAARIAIGAGQLLRRDFPIVALGLVFRDRDVFRSEAHVIVAEAFRWDDLVSKDVNDRDAVRELTRRIEVAMRSVTVNLEQWEDEPIVHAAEEVWRTQFGGTDDAAAKVERIAATAEALKALRSGGDDTWRSVAAELQAHLHELRVLGLRPAELKEDVRVGEAVEWTVSRVPLVVVLPVSLVGAVLFWAPKSVTARIADRLSSSEGPDTLVTYRVLVGAVVFFVWFLLVAAIVWPIAGLGWALLSVVIQPLWAFAALAVGERRQHAWQAAKRFFLRRRARPQLEILRERQRGIAQRLHRLYERVTAATS